jgi:protein-S-isoprenylcysteine O-methyltransferase Ste14
MKQVSDALMFKYRGWIGILCLCSVAAAVVFSTPWVEEDTLTDCLFDALGWGCFVLYVTFRLWATLYVGGRKGRELQTLGPYSLTRNPLYFGGLCFAVATTVLFKSIALLVATVLAAGVYIRWVITAEERILEQTFGDAFREYARRTPRLFPRFSQYRVPQSVEVNVRALQGEAKHLWLASLLPFSVEVLMHLRTAPWWPHWFTLP